MSRFKKNLKLIMVAVFISILFIAIVQMIKIKELYGLNLQDYLKIKLMTESTDETQGSDIKTIGIQTDPPFSFFESQRDYNRGMIPDIINLLNLRSRTDVKLRTAPLESNMTALLRGEIEAIVVDDSKGKRDDLIYSIPIYTVRGRVMVKNGSDIKTLSDLSGKTAVSMTNEKTLENTENYEGIIKQVNFIEMDNIYQCFAYINRFEADAFIGDDLEAAYFSNIVRESSKYRFLDSYIYERKIYIATLPKNKKLMDTINYELLRVKEDGLDEQTQGKWIGTYNYKPYQLKQFNMIANASIIIFLMAIIFITWNYTMKKTVREKTKELSDNKEELNNIINSMESGVLVLDSSDNIVECNYNLSKLIGSNREQMIGKNLSDYSELKYFVRDKKDDDIYMRGYEYYYIKTKTFGDSKKLIVIDDYTKRYISEQKARQESKMIALGQLVAGLAHEIRTPVGLIRSYVYLLRDYITESDGVSALKSIDVNAMRISEFVSNLLNFSRLSKKYIERINLFNLVNSVLEEEKSKIKDRRIELKLRYMGERERFYTVNTQVIKLILINLIDNGIDSIPECRKGEIVVKVHVDKDMIRISVKDNGKGIESELKDQIFNPFFSTKSNGTGLGLYLISIELGNYGGTIDVESTLDVGTEFNVKLPLMEVKS